MIRTPSDAEIEDLWSDLEDDFCVECADLGETCPDCEEEGS